MTYWILNQMGTTKPIDFIRRIAVAGIYFGIFSVASYELAHRVADGSMFYFIYSGGMGISVAVKYLANVKFF